MFAHTMIKCFLCSRSLSKLNRFFFLAAFQIHEVARITRTRVKRESEKWDRMCPGLEVTTRYTHEALTHMTHLAAVAGASQ